MRLHIFNPDHDLALAANLRNFTAPHAGRQLRSDLGFLPALWAETGDYVLVDDVAVAENAYRKLKLNNRTDVQFINYDELYLCIDPKEDIDIQPWGWNKALWVKLNHYGIPEFLLPRMAQIDTIRDLSHRRLAVNLLDKLQGMPYVTGFSCVCFSYEEVLLFLDKNKNIVVKAPWSSSGRGVRYMERETVDINALQWISNTIIKQGGVTAEIKCQKVHDFAVEFIADKNGQVKACGLSLFTTVRGAYTGNILMSEREKEEWLWNYIPQEDFNAIIQEIEKFLTYNIGGNYVGPLGVDMMVVADEHHVKNDSSPSFLINPCIEINLRRTMGHVALALSQNGHLGNMHIDYDGHNYKFRITGQQQHQNNNKTRLH